MHVCVEHIKDGAEGEQGKESSASRLLRSSWQFLSRSGTPVQKHLP